MNVAVAPIAAVTSSGFSVITGFEPTVNVATSEVTLPYSLLTTHLY